MAIEKHELHCHACEMYVRFDLDPEWRNGNYVIECPNCGHEHCRVIKDGEVTDRRWDSRNNNCDETYLPATVFAFSMTVSTGSATSVFTSEAWATVSTA